jgi:two-component system sensor histidine kinase DesK
MMRLLPEDRQLGWTPYAWLVYLLCFPAEPFLEHASWQTWALTGLGIAAFLPLYFWGYWLQGRRKLWAAAGIAALGCLYAPSNPSASVFFIYASSFIGLSAEPRVAFRYLGALLAIIAGETWLFRLPPGFWIVALVLSALLGSVYIHFAEQARLNRKLTLAQEEVEHLAKVAERERIARDLHDLLGHTLSVIVLKSELASRLGESDPQRAMAEIRDVERISREALAQVRSAVRGYRPVGLASELNRTRETLATAGVQVEATLETVPLTPAQESVLALAVREGATNIIRHAQASTCRLGLRSTGTACELEIADDGRGGATLSGGGLSGMRQRVEALGGSLEIDGSRGTTLRVRLPLQAPEAGGTS